MNDITWFITLLSISNIYLMGSLASVIQSVSIFWEYEMEYLINTKSYNRWNAFENAANRLGKRLGEIGNLVETHCAWLLKWIITNKSEANETLVIWKPLLNGKRSHARSHANDANFTIVEVFFVVLVVVNTLPPATEHLLARNRSPLINWTICELMSTHPWIIYYCHTPCTLFLITRLYYPCLYFV